MDTDLKSPEVFERPSADAIRVVAMTEREIFLSALEIEDPAARQAHVQSACAGDAALLARVESLLTLNDTQSQFLETPVVQQLVADCEPDAAPTVMCGTGSTEDPEDPTTLWAGESKPTSENRDESDEIPLGYLLPSDKPGSLGRLAHYDVLEVLGRGAFGIVLKAFDEKLQRVVAIKVLAPEMAGTSPARKRFLREARASAAIRHEHVVSIHAVEETPLPYLVMEYIPGQTLQQRLDGRGPLDVLWTVRFGRQIAEGLAAAHAQGLIHRDIKPGNILLEEGVVERVKLTDFGLARAADDASVSQSGVIAGTPMYMAPEQALGRNLDHRADLFSLGSVLYQMVSGRPPFRAAGTLAVLKRVTQDEPRPIREIIPETPAWLCKIIAKLHAKDPGARYQSAREVAEVLGDCEVQLKAHARLQDFSKIPQTKTARGPARWIWVVAATVLLLPVLALGITAISLLAHWLRRSPSENQAVAWIEVLPLIDPQLDRWKNALTGRNEWRLENGALMTGYADDKPCKLLLPLDGDWQSFEWEVEFTRRSGPGGINLNIPTSAGDCPVVLGAATGVFLGRKGGGVVLNQEIALATGQRTKLRVEVRRDQNRDRVSVWVDDQRAGTWLGDRAAIATAANEGYPHARRLSLWVHQGGTEIVFHRIRVRMLDGGRVDRLRETLRAASVEASPLSDDPPPLPPMAVAPFDAARARAHQEAWARHLGVPVEYTNRVGMRFRLIPAGEFRMGSKTEEIARLVQEARAAGLQEWMVEEFQTEGPQHRATVKEPFYLGAHEVTVADFRRFVDATRYVTEGEKSGDGGWGDFEGQWVRRPEHVWQTPGAWTVSDRQPVVQISWNDARAYCAWLSQVDGLRYVLPGEAQREFAARAGTTGLYGATDLTAALDATAWIDGNLPPDRQRQPQPVGTKAANPFGLYDMSGNVWEWCEDWQPGRIEERRVIRGGGWHTDALRARPANRGGGEPNKAWDGAVGFRVAIVGDLKAASTNAPASRGP